MPLPAWECFSSHGYGCLFARCSVQCPDTFMGQCVASNNPVGSSTALHRSPCIYGGHMHALEGADKQEATPLT